LFVSTGNYAFPRDGEVDRWFYHWLPPEEQARYNDERNIYRGPYWLLTWEEMTALLGLCVMRCRPLTSPDSEHWDDILIDRLRPILQGFRRDHDEYLKADGARESSLLLKLVVTGSQRHPLSMAKGELPTIGCRHPFSHYWVISSFTRSAADGIGSVWFRVPRASQKCQSDRQSPGSDLGNRQRRIRTHQMLKTGWIDSSRLRDNSPQPILSLECLYL